MPTWLFSDPLVDGHKKLEPIFSKPQNNGPAERSSNDDQNGENVSRIIPIKVEKIAGAFNQSKTTTTGTDSPNLNTLQELQQHQSLNKAEESIRGFSKPKVWWPTFGYYYVLMYHMSSMRIIYF